MDEALERLFAYTPILGAGGETVRQRVLLNLGMAAVKIHGKPSISPDDVLNAWKTMGLRGFRRETALAAMEAVKTQGSIAESSKPQVYEVIEIKPTMSMKEAILNAFQDFRSAVEKEYPDYDPYLDSGMQDAFLACIIKLFELSTKLQIDATGIKGVPNREKTLDILSAIAAEKGVKRPRDFADLLYQNVVKNPPKSFRPISASILSVSTTLDFLRKGREIGVLTAGIMKGDRLFIDTNVAVQLICRDTSPLYDLCRETLELSRDLGFEVRLLQGTLKELHRLIEVTITIVEGKARGVRWLWEENQLLHEYSARMENGEKHDEIVQELKNTVQLLDTIHGVKLESEGDLSDEDVQRRLSVLTEVVHAQGKERSYSSLNHDARALTFASKIKQADASQSLLNAPWLVTLDRAVISADRISAGTTPETQCAIFIGDWLSSILPITEFSKLDEHLGKLAKGWLELPFVPEAPLKPNDVSELLGRQMDLQGPEREVFVRAMLKHPLQQSLQSAIRRRDEDTARNLVDKMTRDVIEMLTKEIADRERQVEHLRASLSDLRERLQRRSGDSSTDS